MNRGLRRSGARGDILVLCYHAVSERWACDLAVTPTTLEQQVSHLLDRGYEPVTLSEALGSPSSADRVAVTFDDGYLSIATRAFPTLCALGVPATAFVVTSFMGTGKPMTWPGIDQWLDGRHDDELLPMSWDDARRLLDAGWEIGSHTCTHPYLTQVDDELVDWELTASRHVCERELGTPCRSLAYPHSDVDARIVARAGAAGYDWACTLPRRFVRPGALSWPRIGLYERDGPHTLWLKLSPNVRRLRVSALGPVAEDVHRFVRSKRLSGSNPAVPSHQAARPAAAEESAGTDGRGTDATP